MNAFARIDVETFFRFAAANTEQRYELERGVIVQQMTGGTKRHGLVARRLSQEIEAQIDMTRFTVLQDRGVGVSQSGRFPDIVVEPSDEPGESLRTMRPVLIVEVLSPSTAATDLNAKQMEYLSIPTLDAYVVAHQDEPAVLVWARGENGEFPSEPIGLEGMDKTFDVKGRGFSARILFADIYRGIAPGPR